jgi:hypothetical protein
MQNLLLTHQQQPLSYTKSERHVSCTNPLANPEIKSNSKRSKLPLRVKSNQKFLIPYAIFFARAD